MDLSIIILNYKQSGLVKYCLKRLMALNLQIEKEIIVVDNNSGDNIKEMLLSRFLSVKFIAAAKNKGYAAGNNLGIQAATGKYILILNPDMAIEEQGIMRLYDFMEERADCGICGPKTFNPDGSLQHTCLKFPDWKLPFFRRTFLANTNAGKKWNDYYQMADWDHQSNMSVDWLFGSCLMARRQALEKTGILDERYFLYMEDLDWCRRFWKNKWEVWYISEAKAIHFHQRMSAESGLWQMLFSKTARTHFTSWLKYYIKFRKHAE